MTKCDFCGKDRKVLLFHGHKLCPDCYKLFQTVKRKAIREGFRERDSRIRRLDI